MTINRISHFNFPFFFFFTKSYTFLKVPLPEQQLGNLFHQLILKNKYPSLINASRYYMTLVIFIQHLNGFCVGICEHRCISCQSWFKTAALSSWVILVSNTVGPPRTPVHTYKWNPSGASWFRGAIELKKTPVCRKETSTHRHRRRLSTTSLTKGLGLVIWGKGNKS